VDGKPARRGHGAASVRFWLVLSQDHARGTGAEAAGPPTIEYIQIDEDRFLPRTSEICGLPLYEHFEGTIKVATKTMPDRSIRHHETGTISITFHSDAAHSMAIIASCRVGTFTLVEHPDGSVTIRSSGLEELITQPGEGHIFMHAGVTIIEIDPNGEETVIQHGQFDESFAPAICALF
jgi:hypothetical protein